jgi:DNA-binding transcriptional regulator YiaG
LKNIADIVVGSANPLTGQEIRYLRKSLGKSSRDFAKLVGVTPDQVSRWELNRNRPEPSADKLIRMLACHGEPVMAKHKDKIVIRVARL